MKVYNVYGEIVDNLLVDYWGWLYWIISRSVEILDLTRAQTGQKKSNKMLEIFCISMEKLHMPSK